MMIRVMYSDGRFDVVKQSTLDQLLERNRVASFKRSSGWAVVGRDVDRDVDPDRARSPFEGEEKRLLEVITDEGRVGQGQPGYFQKASARPVFLHGSS